MLQFLTNLFWQLANLRLQRSKPIIIGITGSIAKTSTKRAVGAVLSEGFPGQVLTGFGNLNTELGVALAILELDLDFHHRPPQFWRWPGLIAQAWLTAKRGSKYRYWVLELAADKPGDITALSKRLKLDVAVITLTGPAHRANFKSTEQIAREKGQIIKAVKPNGLVLLNNHDQYRSHYPHFKNIQTFHCPTEAIAVTIARRLGEIYKIPSTTIDQALAKPFQPTGRLQIINLRQYKLIDDSYNANPMSMQAAFNVLGRLPGRKVAILGAMAELGPQEAKYHQEVGAAARQAANLVIGVGELAKHYKADKWYPNSHVAAEAVLAELKTGDSILVKGSRSQKMELVTEAIKR